MPAKLVQVSSDDATYYTLPGNTGELTREGANIDDTIFGQTFKSGITGIIGWGMNANAVYKGYPGYAADLKKPGTSTPMTDEPCALVSGKTYRVTNVAKRVLNRAVAVVVEDNNVDHTADVLEIDYLFGKVTFKPTYTVTGAVSITGAYFPTISIGKATAYTLTQTADAIDTTDFGTAKTNGGYRTHTAGLRNVTLEFPAVFNVTDDWDGVLAGRTELIIEVNPDGLGEAGGSLCRGFYRLMTDRQAGNVGALEEETLMFQLNVPLLSTAYQLALPFGWAHSGTSPIPLAIKKILDQWEAQGLIYGKYLPDGLAGWKGQGVTTNFTLTGGMEAMNSFAWTLQASGAPTQI